MMKQNGDFLKRQLLLTNFSCRLIGRYSNIERRKKKRKEKAAEKIENKMEKKQKNERIREKSLKSVSYTRTLLK